MIRHLIVFNADAPAEQVRAMAERGKRELGSVPGVTDVRFGEAVGDSARYRYVFDIGFADEATIDVYKQHPAHVRFADEHFRPMAADRVTTDYRIDEE